MKTIIAGSRSITDVNVVAAAVELSGFSAAITEVVSGKATGVDTAGEKWAATWGIPVKDMPANWYPLAPPDHRRMDWEAGYKRNFRMAECARALVAVWDGASGGTAHMIRTAKAMGLRVFVYIHSPGGLPEL